MFDFSGAFSFASAGASQPLRPSERQINLDLAVRRAYAQYPISIPCKHCHCDSCQAAWVNLAGPFTAMVRAEFRKLTGAT